MMLIHGEREGIKHWGVSKEEWQQRHEKEREMINKQGEAMRNATASINDSAMTKKQGICREVPEGWFSIMWLPLLISPATASIQGDGEPYGGTGTHEIEKFSGLQAGWQ